jgi:nucleotide-binding universal stress UspA family protein
MAPSRFARVTVAIDGSPSAQEALEEAIDLAKQYGSELTVLCVAAFVPVFMPSPNAYVPATVTETDVGRYRDLVDAGVKQALDSGVKAVTGVCLEGVTVDEILAHVETHPTDLLVVGSRGLSAAKRLLIGSVSGALVSHAPCPVLVVRLRPVTKPAA